MNLYILRHAIAVERGTPGYADDSKRPLTPQGQAKMIQNAQGIQALGLSFDAILSSPYVRAKATADIVAAAYGLSKRSIHVTGLLTPDASFEDLTRDIGRRFPTAKDVLVVGHEPHLSGLIGFLLTGQSSLPMELKKGGLCALRCSRSPGKGNATLLWFATPSQLRKFR